MSRPALERVWLWPGSDASLEAALDAAPWENLAHELGGETALAQVFWYRGLRSLTAVRAAFPPLNLDTDAL